MIRDIQNIDDDIIRAKRIIKEKLINDPDVIEVLDNPKLDPEEPDTNFYKPEDDATENVSPEEESENVDQ